MALRVLGRVRAIIARTTYTLICDVNALCAIEIGMGCDITDALHRFDTRALRLSDERIFLAALLSKHHPEFDLDLAGDLMSRDVTGARAAVELAIKAALPEVDPGKKSRAARAAAWICASLRWRGKRSG